VEGNTATPEVHDPSPGTGLGGRLVAARKARGLTLAVVADKLRLSAGTVQALEASRFADLPEPIFVRGYLRAYARLLEMDTEVFVAEYDRLVGTPEPVLKPATRVRRQSFARTPYIRGAAALIMVAIGALLSSWWYSRLKHDAPAQSQSAFSEAEQPASPASIPSPLQTGALNLTPGPAAPPPPDIPPQSLANEAAREIEREPRTDGTAPAAAESAPPVPSESPVSANTGAVAQRQDVESTGEPPVADLPIAPLASRHGRLVRASRAPTGGDVLVIKANAESWADVVDANGYQLLYYPLRPGMVRRLQGQAPFRVFLGNAPAVDLSVNEKRFDHTPYHRPNRTARFSVDGST
jgi:cytoskeleton protein RodZ